MGAFKTIPVVIDTNVLVSGLLYGGKPGEFVELWKNRRIQPYISKAMVNELVRVLAYPKFPLTADEIDYLLYSEVLTYFEVTTTKDGPVIVEDDPQDDMFLRCAEAAEAKIAVTGDRYLLSLKTYRSISILTPARFLDKVEKAE
jgi:putative PIN family toxin of toxin-antitoxin system